jgi:hypothetical protein
VRSANIIELCAAIVILTEMMPIPIVIKRNVVRASEGKSGNSEPW